jgi:hypothetical protein
MPLDISVVAMPVKTFGEVSPGDLFHFVRGKERELATYVKIDPGHARAQAGGEVVTAAPGELVCVVGL